MQVLVTGASGFVGRNACAYLESIGHTVIRTARTQPGDTRGQTWRVTGDLAAHADLTALLRDIDVVIHAAGRAHAPSAPVGRAQAKFHRANVVATERLAQAAAQTGVRRFVLVSSIGIYGRAANHPITEADAFAPEELYATSKLHAEERLRAIASTSSLEAVIVRPTLIYGPNCPGNMARLVGLVKRGWPLPLAAYTQPRSLLAVDHLCSLLGLSVEHPAAAHQAFVAADPQMVSLVQILKAIAQGLDMPLKLWRVPDALLRAGATLAGLGAAFDKLVRPLQVDATFAQTRLGWQPQHSTIEGIRKTAASFQTQPLLTAQTQ